MSALSVLLLCGITGASGLSLGHVAGYARGQRETIRAAHMIRRAVEGARR